MLFRSTYSRNNASGGINPVSKTRPRPFIPNGGTRSVRPCTGVNDRPDMLATQRGGEPAWHKPVDDLHALDVTGGRHDLEKRSVKRQRALELCNIRDGRLAQKLRLLSAGALGVSGVHAVHVLHDREASGAQRVRQQECARVGPVDWNA